MPLIDISETDLSFLKNLSHEIKTQDNAGTATPYFITVRTSRALLAPPDFGDGASVLVDPDDFTFAISCDENTPEGLRQRGVDEEDLEATANRLDEYGTHIVYEDHNVFFTRKGFENHMELNGHNYRDHSLKDPHSYTQHAFRNPEIKQLLEIVHRLGAP